MNWKTTDLSYLFNIEINPTRYANPKYHQIVLKRVGDFNRVVELIKDNLGMPGIWKIIREHGV